MTRRVLALATAVIAFAAPSAAAQDVPLPQYPGQFELVGHNPLNNRGMNAALAVFGGYAYVGSRTDGTHVGAGVLVVDVRNPAAPTVVGEMGLPDQAQPTQTSRELRILPDQKLLLVLNHQCSELIHRCASPSNTGISVFPSTIKIYDIAGENAAAPQLVATYSPSATGPQLPHEFFVWNDPLRPGRVLVYASAPRQDSDLIVTDFSRAREGVFTEIAKFTSEADDGLHSMTVSNDGRRLYLAHLQGGVIVADSSEVAEGRPEPTIHQLTTPDNAPTWPGPGAHSAAPLPGRPGRLMITDEVYGKLGGVLAGHGCPWGWARFVDARNPSLPTVDSEYKLPVNEPAFCESLSPDRDQVGSLAAHNPTLTENLALLSWHGAGMQAIVTSDPAAPKPAAGFMPEPLPFVQTEDPALSQGQDKVVMWSFPSIVDGLVYVVDLRNGLYVLRYRGPFEEEVARVRFLDGASNTGDVQRMEPVGASDGPAVGGPPPCLAAPLRARGNRFGPFKLGMTRAEALLRGGPLRRARKASLRYCVAGGGAAAVALRDGRVAFIGVTARAIRGVPKPLRPGSKRAGNRLVLRRGKGFTLAARARGGRVRWTALATGRPSPKALRKLARTAGLR